VENGGEEGDGEDSAPAILQGEAVLGGSGGWTAVDAGAVREGEGSRRGRKEGRGRRGIARRQARWELAAAATGVDGGRLEWGAEWSGKGTMVGHPWKGNMNEFSVFYKEISHHLVRTFDWSKWKLHASAQLRVGNCTSLFQLNINCTYI
jgi:hypothetical protein